MDGSVLESMRSFLRDEWKVLVDDFSRLAIQIETGIKNLSQRFSSFLAPLSVVSVGILVITYLTSQIPSGNPFAVIGIFAFILDILLFDLAIAIPSIAIWRFGRWARIKASDYWQSQVPPHYLVVDISRESISEVVDHHLNVNGPHLLPAPRINPKAVFTVVCLQLSIGYLLVGLGFSGFLALPIQTIPEIDIKMNPFISTLSAFISVLLGPLLGAISLGLFASANSLENLLIGIFWIMLPMVVIAPASRNIAGISEYYHVKIINRYTLNHRLLNFSVWSLMPVFYLFLLALPALGILMTQS